MSRGLHIVFEGPEAVGKSTQIANVKKYIEDKGFTVVSTRQPGMAGLGIKLREILLDTDMYIDPRAEALMMAADRAQNVAVEIVPSIERGEIVLSDRHVPSSLVYQGIVRELGLNEVANLSKFACNGHEPDITLFFELDDETARSRAKPEPDRMEREGEIFHQKVRDAYRELARDDKYNLGWTIIDASGSNEEVFSRIQSVIDPLLSKLS